MFSFFKRDKQENKFTKPYYSFRSVLADRVLDICQDGENQGSLIIWEGYGGDNQQFTIKQKGDDFYIKCRKDRQYLTVQGGHDGARIFGAPKNYQQNQRFKVVEKEEGSKEYYIYTYCGKVLDVCEGKKQNGTQIIQWEFNGNENQLWNFCDPANITSESSEID